MIAAPADYGEGRFVPSRLADEPHPTLRRRNHFASIEAMFERFASRRPYVSWDPRVLHDYCEWGLLPRADGDGFELACPPEIEASVYATSRTNGGIHDSVRRVRVPVTILRARVPSPDRDWMDFSSSPTWPGLASAFTDAYDVHLADHSHFIPMEAPELTAGYVLSRDGDGAGAGAVAGAVGDRRDGYRDRPFEREGPGP